jgi:hypothetical protein
MAGKQMSVATSLHLSFDNMGAWIIGRNMFVPVRDPTLVSKTNASRSFATTLLFAQKG